LHPLDFAREEVETVCQALLAPTPSALNSCATNLAAAISGLKASATTPLAGDADLLSKAYALRQALGRASALLESAASFHAGWNRILNTMTAGYTSCGEAASHARAGKICLQG